MKKVLKVFIACLLIITIFVVMKINNINILDGFSNMIELVKDVFTSGEKIAYSNDFKVNRLQMKSADYFYNQLTDNQKNIYSAVANSVKNLDSNVDVKKYVISSKEDTTKDVGFVLQSFFADHPEVFYLDSKYTVSITNSIIGQTLKLDLVYTVKDKKELEEKLNLLDEKITSYSNVAANSNYFDREVYAHDKFGKDVSYYNYVLVEDIPSMYHTSYGALIEKKAVCDGLTKALQLIFDRVGIESILVSGILEEQPHAWNMVRLENSWYHVDLTSNKLIKETNGAGYNVVHSYFNIDDEEILKSHTIDAEYAIPKSNDTRYNYYVVTGSYIYSTDNFDSKLKNIVNNQKNSTLLEFATDTITNVKDKMVKVLIDINFNNYAATRNASINYYKILNTFVVLKK